MKKEKVQKENEREEKREQKPKERAHLFEYDDKEEELTPSKLEELFEASPDSSFVYRPADMVTTEESATGEGQTAAMPPNSDSTDSIDE